MKRNKTVVRRAIKQARKAVSRRSLTGQLDEARRQVTMAALGLGLIRPVQRTVKPSWLKRQWSLVRAIVRGRPD